MTETTEHQPGGLVSAMMRAADDIFNDAQRPINRYIVRRSDEHGVYFDTERDFRSELRHAQNAAISAAYGSDGEMTYLRDRLLAGTGIPESYFREYNTDGVLVDREVETVRHPRATVQQAALEIGGWNVATTPAEPHIVQEVGPEFFREAPIPPENTAQQWIPTPIAEPRGFTPRRRVTVLSPLGERLAAQRVQAEREATLLLDPEACSIVHGPLMDAWSGMTSSERRRDIMWDIAHSRPSFTNPENLSVYLLFKKLGTPDTGVIRSIRHKLNCSYSHPQQRRNERLIELNVPIFEEIPIKNGVVIVVNLPSWINTQTLYPATASVVRKLSSTLLGLCFSVSTNTYRKHTILTPKNALSCVGIPWQEASECFKRMIPPIVFLVHPNDKT